jgi:hypothetical protein
VSGSYPCVKCCGRPLFPRPDTTCFWCRGGRSPLEITQAIVGGIEKTMDGKKQKHQVLDEFEQERQRLRKRKWRK